MQIKRFVVGDIATNCYFLINQNELAIVDPGGEADKILAEIRTTDLKPKYIINTHAHFDHTLANDKIREATSAQILIHQNEKDLVDFTVDRFLKSGEKIKVGNEFLEIIHTPGHTPGSICLIEKGFILTGDTLFQDGYGRTDLAGGSQKEIEKSLDKIAKLLKPAMVVYPGHGEIFIVQGNKGRA
jgi:glyoxylase-like metal-dependent hydrolase (beta-lactamase superfamily II)